MPPTLIPNSPVRKPSGKKLHQLWIIYLFVFTEIYLIIDNFSKANTDSI